MEIDARVGGCFNITRRDGEDVEHVGTYLEIDRPRRLVFTFGVPKFSAQMTRVSIDLKPLPAGCELTLTHEGVLPEWLESGAKAGVRSSTDCHRTWPSKPRYSHRTGHGALAQASADVRMPPNLSDHMVLQRDVPISVWVRADSRELASVTFGGR